MDAGRDLDIAVAQQVCKLMVMLDHDAGKHRVISPRRKVSAPLPFYSTQTEHAYLVTNLLQASGFYCHVRSPKGSGVFRVAFYRNPGERFEAESDSLPHAIAVAALKVGQSGLLD